MEHLTFTDAAALLGCSLKTIYRHVAKGSLVTVDTPQGRRIERSSVDCRLSGQVSKNDNGPGTGDKGGSVPASVHLEALKMLGELHQEALKESRARVALETQLAQYQRAMAEQCESLAEERAWRKHLEASAAMVAPADNSPAPDIGDLKQDMPTSKRGFRYRLRRWLLGSETG